MKSVRLPGMSLGSYALPDRGNAETSCSWCREGLVPHPSTGGICGQCVHRFRRLLQSTRWAKARRAYLAEHTFCVCPECQAAATLQPATDIDHIIPWRLRPDLFWDMENWQPLTHAHHSRKTARGE